MRATIVGNWTRTAYIIKFLIQVFLFFYAKKEVGGKNFITKEIFFPRVVGTLLPR